MQNKLPSDPNNGNEVEKAAREQMKKKTAEELAEMAVTNRAFSAESCDDPPPLVQKRSESSLDGLNAQLKSVPLVKAFNSAEKHHLEDAAKKKKMNN